jgi:hypothetical protein
MHEKNDIVELVIAETDALEISGTEQGDELEIAVSELKLDERGVVTNFPETHSRYTPATAHDANAKPVPFDHLVKFAYSCRSVLWPSQFK